MKTAAIVVAALIAFAPTVASADPDVHSIVLPDGSTLMTVTDTNSQLWGPSSTQRVLVQCQPGTPCMVLDSQVASFNFLQGIWGAIGEAVRRPARINNTTAVSNGSVSSSDADAVAISTNANNVTNSAQGGQGGAGGNNGNNGNNAQCGVGQQQGNGQGCE